MIEIDGRDHGQRRMHHIGGIEPAAQSHFDDRRMDAFFPKEQKSHGGDGFKIAGMAIQIERFGGVVNDIEGARKLGFADRKSIHLNTFDGFHQDGAK